MTYQIINFIITISLLILPAGVLAAGLLVSPSKLDFSLTPQSKLEQTLTIVNPTADVQVFEVYADDFTDVIKATPSSFTLESGAIKKVNILIDAKSLNVDQHLVTNLSVVGKPLAESKFSVGAGAKIPIFITVASSAKPKIPGWAFWSIAIAGLITVLTLKNPRRRSSGEN